MALSQAIAQDLIGSLEYDKPVQRWAELEVGEYAGTINDVIGSINDKEVEILRIVVDVKDNGQQSIFYRFDEWNTEYNIKVLAKLYYDLTLKEISLDAFTDINNLSMYLSNLIGEDVIYVKEAGSVSKDGKQFYNYELKPTDGRAKSASKTEEKAEASASKTEEKAEASASKTEEKAEALDFIDGTELVDLDDLDIEL